MYFTDTLRGLWRRWYIVLPGLFITAALAIGAWNLVPAGYERTSTQLLVPGAGSIPAGANPYLYLGGLGPAADVVVRAVGSVNLINEVVAEHPGVKIEVTRDTTTAGPVILIAVTAPSDAAAAEVQELLMQRTSLVLNDIQRKEGIVTQNRVTALPVTVDSESILQERSRFIAVGAAGLGGLTLTLLITGLVNGFSSQRKREQNMLGSEAAGTFPPHEAPDIAGLATPASRAPVPSPAGSFRSAGSSARSTRPRGDRKLDTATSALRNLW